LTWRFSEMIVPQRAFIIGLCERQGREAEGMALGRDGRPIAALASACLNGVTAMTGPDGIQRKPPAPTPNPSGIQNVPSSTNGQSSVAELKKCPHCGHSLTSKDVEIGLCWFCEKRMADPVEPTQPTPPYLAMLLLGGVGAILGVAFAVIFLREIAPAGSWTMSLCGGIGYAAGAALARLLFSKESDSR
jgi:hypothetical protein